MSELDDTQARKARADAIRRARDARNAEIDAGGDSADAGSEGADSKDGGTPNYADLIDKQMRRDQQRDE